MTICIQCTLRQMVEGQPPEKFNETPEEHMARVHPNPYATYRERQRLEAKAFAMGLIPAENEGHGD